MFVNLFTLFIKLRQHYNIEEGEVGKWAGRGCKGQGGGGRWQENRAEEKRTRGRGSEDIRLVAGGSWQGSKGYDL